MAKQPLKIVEDNVLGSEQDEASQNDSESDHDEPPPAPRTSSADRSKHRLRNNRLVSEILLTLTTAIDTFSDDESETVKRAQDDKKKKEVVEEKQEAVEHAAQVERERKRQLKKAGVKQTPAAPSRYVQDRYFERPNHAFILDDDMDELDNDKDADNESSSESVSVFLLLLL